MPVQRNTTPLSPSSTAVPTAPGGSSTPRDRNSSGTAQQRTSVRSRSRLGATWVGICFGAVVLLLLLVFMLQNTQPVDVSFLGWTGTAPLALTLLIAALGAAAVTLVLGSIRIGQLRHRLARARRAGATPAVAL